MSTLTQEQIRPQHLMADKQGCVDADRQFLLDHEQEWVPVDCPACQANQGTAYGQKQGFSYQQCQACETVYTNPRPSQDLLHRFYKQSKNYAYWNEHVFPATEEARRTRIFNPRAQRLAEICETHGIDGGTLLEIGAAFGTFCVEVEKQNRFERIVAVEPTPGLAATCRKRGLETLEAFVEDISESGFADVVAAFEVLEHLFAPQQFVHQIHRILRPGGTMILSCPNVQGFDVATLKTSSSTFDHEHINYFHPESLALLCRESGFDVLQLSTPGQLDAELVRNAILAGQHEPSLPLINDVLINRWEELGTPFQDFLAANRLSSHMWIVARRR